MADLLESPFLFRTSLIVESTSSKLLLNLLNNGLRDFIETRLNCRVPSGVVIAPVVRC